MKLNRCLFTGIILLVSRIVFSQSSADTTLHLQNINIQGKLFGGLSGGEIRKLTVENNLSILSGTTADALRQLPSLITDIEGGVLYRGSTKSGMLLHGVPYGLLEEYNGDMLIQLPALFFNHISLNSYPPIEFIPDGDAGLLNLSSTVHTASDPLLHVTIGAGLHERYNAGAVLNVHTAKFHIIGKYNYRREFRERSFRKTTTNTGGTTEMDNNASARPDVHIADLSMGYDLTSNDRITIYGLYYLMEYDRYGGINNTKRNATGEIQNKILRHRFNHQKQDAYAIEAKWNHQFNDEYNKLELLFNYNNFLYDENNHFKNEKPETGNIIAEDQSFIDHTKKNYHINVLYQKVIDYNWFLKVGYIVRLRKEDYTSLADDKVDDNWQLNKLKSNEYSYDRFTHVVFASIEKGFDKVKVEAGAQLEHLKHKMFSSSKSHLHLYPRIKFSYLINSNDKIVLSYIQRVVRPYGIDLNPFIDNTDATYVHQGNPELKDEYIHSVELNYQFVKPHFRLSPALYYRSREDRIMDLATEMEGQTVWRKENMGTSQTVGFEISGNWNPINPLGIGISGNIFRDEIDGRLIGYDEKKSLVCWDIKGNVSLSFTPSTELQIDAFYVSDQLTPQGKIKSRYSVNAGLSQYLLQRRLRANLSIQNIFDSQAETTIIDAPGLQMTQVRNRDPRVAWLTLTYHL